VVVVVIVFRGAALAIKTADTFVLPGWRILEYMMDPMRRGGDNKKQPRHGKQKAGTAPDTWRLYAKQSSHERNPSLAWNDITGQEQISGAAYLSGLDGQPAFIQS
jgi:hypothetical protein